MEKLMEVDVGVDVVREGEGSGGSKFFCGSDCDLEMYDSKGR
jgi:hypothetical protein